MAASFPVLVGAVVLDATNNGLRIEEAASSAWSVTIPAGTYYLYEDGTDTTDGLINALTTALDAESASSGQTWTYTAAISFRTAPGAVSAVVSGAGIAMRPRRFVGGRPFNLKRGDPLHSRPAAR